MSVRDDLAAVLVPQGEPPLRMRTGVIDSVGSGTVMVRLGGSATAVPATYAASYTPVVDDVVVALHQGAVVFVVDKVAT